MSAKVFGGVAVALLTVGAFFFATTEASEPEAPANVEEPERESKPVHPARAKVEAGAILLDVRTPGEFQSGHIEGAINIPVQQLESRIAELPADKEVVVYCRSGARSASATRIMESKGISQVYDLGSIRAWR